MINLLPPSAITALRREYLARVVTVWLVLFAGVGICGVVALLPSYVFLDAQIGSFQAIATEAKEQDADFTRVAADLVMASNLAAAVMQENDVPMFAPILSRIEDLAGREITITTLAFNRTEAVAIAPITVTGVAQTRQALAKFRDVLLAEPDFVTVDLPISNLAKDTEVPFTITVTVAPPTP
jgi:hypothetical protein